MMRWKIQFSVPFRSKAILHGSQPTEEDPSSGLVSESGFGLCVAFNDLDVVVYSTRSFMIRFEQKWISNFSDFCSS